MVCDVPKKARWSVLGDPPWVVCDVHKKGRWSPFGGPPWVVCDVTYTKLLLFVSYHAICGSEQGKQAKTGRWSPFGGPPCGAIQVTVSAFLEKTPLGAHFRAHPLLRRQKANPTGSKIPQNHGGPPNGLPP